MNLLRKRMEPQVMEHFVPLECNYCYTSAVEGIMELASAVQLHSLLKEIMEVEVPFSVVIVVAEASIQSPNRLQKVVEEGETPSTVKSNFKKNVLMKTYWWRWSSVHRPWWWRKK